MEQFYKKKLFVRRIELVALGVMGTMAILCPTSGLAQVPPAMVPIPRALTLADAETLLLQRNLAIAVNRRQLEAAEALKLIAGYKPNPTIQLGGEQISIASPVRGGAPRFFATNPDAGANSVYTFLFLKAIERGGKRKFRVSQAAAQIAAAKAQILDTYRQQLLQLRQAYGGAMMSRLTLELVRNALADYRKTEALTEVRVQAGDAAQSELYRVKSGRLPYQQAVLQAESGYRQACLDVLNLLNSQRDQVVVQPASADTPQDSVLDIGGEFSDKGPMLVLDELKRSSLRERPDIEVARRSLESAQFGTRLAEAQRRRDITVGTEYQRVGDDSSVGVTASFPVFVYNNQKAGIEQAVAQERVGDLQVRQAEVQALTDVEKAWEKYQASQQALKVYSAENLDQTEKLRAIAFFSYQNGATSLFELLDAQRTLLQARLGYLQARFDLRSSIWMLEAAVGRDLEGTN